MATKTKSAGHQTDETAFPMGDFQETGNVTVGSWKWEEGTPKFFKVLSPVHEGTGKKDSARPKPWLCMVRDLKSKTHYQLILGKMILDAFQESFPGDKIVGKCFAAVRYAVPDANWFRYDVRTIADPEPQGAGEE